MNKFLANFSGGMNPGTSPLLIKDNEAELIVNYHLDTIGALKKRGGYTQRPPNQILSGKTVNGMYSFYDASGNSVIHLAVANNAGDTQGVIYSSAGAGWTARLSTDTASKRTRFATFVDRVFRVNGADLVFTSSNGTTWEDKPNDANANVPDTITPSYIAVFQDRVYLAHGGTSNKSRFWFSSLPTSGAITWDTTNDWVDINPDDNDEITAIENNGNRLLIFKHNALYRWSFGQVEPDRLIGIGTPSQESVKTNFDLGITFFANRFGVYAYTGARPKKISQKIQPFINAVSNWSTVSAEVDDDHYYLSVGNLTVGNRTFSNVVLVYTVSLDAWVVFTLADPVKFMQNMVEVNDKTIKEVRFGDNDGYVYLFSPMRASSGTGTILESDYDSEIFTEFISKEYILAYPNKCMVRWVDVFCQDRLNESVFIDFDRKDIYTPLGVLTNRRTNLKVPVGECHSIRLRISGAHNDATSLTIGQPLIEGFNIEHEPQQKRDEASNVIRPNIHGGV